MGCVRWLRLILLFAGVLLLAGGLATGWQGQRTRTALEHDLTVEAAERASGVPAYFNRARDVALLPVHNRVFTDFYAAPGERVAKIRRDTALMAEVNSALAYLQRLYPGRIGEACFIDSGGAENARVVSGKPAVPNDLSPHESHNPFFQPTFALDVGQVYQAQPYVSPDTHEWVISNSTPVPLPAGQHAIIHFEVTMEGMRQAVAPEDSRLEAQIVDRANGEVLVDSRVPQQLGEPGAVPPAARGDVRGAAARTGGRTAARPGPVQDRQRHSRPPSRRQAARRRGRPAAPRGRPRSSGRAAGRRRVRHPRRPGAGPVASDPAGRQRVARHPPAGTDRRRTARHQPEPRHRPRSRARGHARAHARLCRRGDVPRQAHRQPVPPL